MIDKKLKLTEIYEKHRKEIEFLNVSADLKNPVFGAGNVNARIMLIGEAPGAQEVESCCPFVGKAGKELNALLELIGLDRESLYLTNCVKYRPIKPGSNANRNPTRKEIDAARYVLQKEIGIIMPDIVITLGNSPLYAVTADKKLKIGLCHGEFLIADKESLQANEKALQANEEALRANEEALRSNEEALQANEEALQANEEAVQADKEALQADKRALQANEEALRANEEALQANEDALQADKGALKTDEELVQSDEKLMQVDEKLIRVDEKLVQFDKKMMQIDDRYRFSIFPMYHPASIIYNPSLREIMKSDAINFKKKITCY